MPPDSLSPYTPLVDLDPPLVSHVMDALESAGIAAFAEPIVGDVGPYREVRADRPITRVYVLREYATQARELLNSTLPGLRAEFHADAVARVDRERLDIAELDARWSEILRDYGDRPTLDPPERPSSGSGLSGRLVRRSDRDDSPGVDRTAPVPGGDDDLDDLLEAADRFVPPEPPPLPRPRHGADRFGWGALIGGPVLVLIAFVLGWDRWIALAGGAMFVTGFVTLVARMDNGERDDDGAVV